jgi:8-oxo-dGTP pyrophosphatase MutT (NUDIX family)
MASVPDPALRPDGDGWVHCSAGHRHWGRNGAAGLLLRGIDGAGQIRVLLQKRAWWTHHGDTWGLPGGAMASWETPQQTALRETTEEVTIDLTSVSLEAVHADDHGGWCYTTVIASTRLVPTAAPRGHETAAVRWVDLDDVPTLDLHPGLAASWPFLVV